MTSKKSPTSVPGLVVAFAISLLLHVSILLIWSRPLVEIPGSSSPLRYVKLSLTTRTTAVSADSSSNISKRIEKHEGAIDGPTDASHGRATKPPQLLDQIDENFVWPDGVARSGGLTMRLLIGINGRPLEINVVDSSFTREVESEIVRRFYEARYSPGEINNRPVVSEFVISVDLR